MKTHRTTLLLVYILLFVLGCKEKIDLSAPNEKKVEAVDRTIGPSGVLDMQSVLFVEVDVLYCAPKEGEVRLVWKPHNHSLGEAVKWNTKSKRSKDFIYNSMVASRDTFRVRLNVPVNTSIEYSFWITKNAQNQYKDYWDSSSSNKILAASPITIQKNVQYINRTDKKDSKILVTGWLVLLILITIYLLLNWSVRKWLVTEVETTKIKKIIFLSISLMIFHALSRSEIIGVDPRSVLNNFDALAKIIKGSKEDFLYVLGLMFFFVLMVYNLQDSRKKGLIYTVFLFLVFVSTLVAFANINTVVFLGKPFNFQWLYYSDFLGSDDAKTALQENLSLVTVVNLIAFGISVFVLSRVLSMLYGLIPVSSRMKPLVLSICGMVVLLLLYKSYTIKETWKKGSSQNAISSFVYSMATNATDASFFSIQLPETMSNFDPAEGTRVSAPLVSPKGNQVKNILFLVLESAGSVYFDGYGGNYHITPNLNRYAYEALVFDQVYAHAPGTNQSLVSILGSMYPYLSYKSLTEETPDFKHPTMSSILKEKGYKTSFFTSADLSFLSSNKFLSSRGFDRIEDYTSISCMEQFEQNIYQEGNGIDDICLADRFSLWLDNTQAENFFSVIWTVQGHYPYFFAKEEEDFGVNDINFNRYLNALKHNDELVGKVMKDLEDRGLAASTLVVVTGDHGEAFGQHNQYGHGTAIYDENLRVPLYFINSSLFNGQRNTDLVGMKDLAPTAFSLINMEYPDLWQGRDLLSTNSQEVFFFAPWSDYLFGYRSGNKKFIFNESQNEVEVYDLSTDPKEKINLFSVGMRQEVEQARFKLGAWVQYQDKFIKGIMKENY